VSTGALAGALSWAAEHYGEDPPLWVAGGWRAVAVPGGVCCTGPGEVEHVVLGVDLEGIR